MGSLSRLKLSRLRSGMTQTEVAEALGMSRASYEAVENKRRRAWPKFRKDVAELLCKSEGWLFSESLKQKGGS